MSTSHIHNDSEGGIFYKKLSKFLSKFDEQQKSWYEKNMRRRFYYYYFKDNEKLLMLIMLKPNLLIQAYKILMNKRTSYQFSTDDLLDNFLNYLKNSEKLLDFLHEYSYSYSEQQLLQEINKYSSRKYNDVYYYLFTHVPLKSGNYLRLTFPNIDEFTDDMLSFDSYSSSSSSSRYNRGYSSTSSGVIRGYNQKKKNSKKNSSSASTNNSKKTKNQKNSKKSKKVKPGEYYNAISKKTRPLDKSYYTKKYKDLIDSYPPNKTFSKCHYKAPDSYRKYRCNFFYNNCPDGWQSEHNGDISRCNCNGSSYKYYNNIFDCNPSLGIIYSGSEKETGKCESEPKNKKEFGICFNKAYSKIKKIHQKNNTYYDEIIKSNDEKTKSNLYTKININETYIKKYASKLKSQFPKRDLAEYLDFAEFIEGYLADPLNFIN